ncbi:MAG TPA: FAD-dependent oxidoreductase [Aestuariivirgaceae bacterium]|nr:FAD-dependent oxidoreductase [Aestuariivirgaceae bacterium]
MAIACDLCVIGAGSAGLAVAAAAAQFGERVVLIEKAKMGGDCLNYGCVPSKALIAAARQAYCVSAGGGFGIAAAEPRIDFAAVHDHVHGVIASIAPTDSQERFEKLGVRVIRAAARFTDPQTVVAGGEEIRARRFVIATGSTPAVPPIPGLDKVDYFTNETIFDNRTLLERLIVIGAGPVGLELAQAHRRLGCEVTVVEAMQPLANDDPELVQVVLERLAKEGVEIVARASVTRLARAGKAIEVTFTREDKSVTLSGSHLLIAAGRAPTVAGLGLEAAGIAYSKKGITVDAGLRTSNRKVYAIGDVTGGLQFTHVASYHAGLVIRNALFGLPVRASNDHIPRVTFTDPELAHVGLSEKEAKARGETVSVVSAPFRDNDRAQAERATEGLIKVVAGRRGRILGATIVGKGAGELILPWGLAISSRLTLKAMVDTVVAYPTMGEIGRRAAISHYSGLAENPWVRRLIGVVKWFG